MDGVLVVAKPVGPTSHDVVGLVRRLAATKRVGHGGTLDPFARGVLPVFLGKATRLVEYHLADRKRYRATVCFGASSTTDDLEGALTPANGPPPSRAEVEAALAAFRGPIEQRPPAYSAIKVAGRRAYAMARAGEAVELAPRTVTIHEVTLVSWDEATLGEPIAVVDVECSAGTYVRSLARDLGAAVGNAAYLGALTRTASGPFDLGTAIDLDAVRAAAADGPAAVESLLLPADAGLDLPKVVVPDAALVAIGRGQPIGVPAGTAALDPARPIRLVDGEGRLLAIARLVGGRLAPDKVLIDAPAGVGRPEPRMKTAIGRSRLDAADGPLFIAVGVFDGLHRGHTYLLEHLVLEARARAARPAVITFDAHPDAVLLGHAPPLLMDPAERLEHLSEAGVEVVVVEHFDEALRQTTYDDFLHGITSRCALAGIVMTPDAAFGHDRAGTPETVGELGARDGFDVVIVPPFALDGREVRSSDIRAAIGAGDLARAERLLGRPYAVVGEVNEAGQMTFAMPVALPPAGRYRVSARPAGRATGSRAVEMVVDDGTATLQGPSAPEPTRVAFAAA